MTGSRLYVWEALGRFGAEVAHVRFDASGRMSAHGTQISAGDGAYRLDYRLETDDRLVTRRLRVELQGASYTRRIDLRRDERGAWDCESSAAGDVALAPPGGDMRELGDALDCDLAFSPLTNLMPVRREGLLERGCKDFTMAWVAVPSLQVVPSHQTYEFVGRDDAGSIVRYIGRHRGFTGELRFDHDGFIRLYPALGVRHFPPVPAGDREAAGT